MLPRPSTGSTSTSAATRTATAGCAGWSGANGFTLDWQDGQPNVYSNVDPDQYAIDNDIRYDVRFDAIGRVWFGYCDYGYYGPAAFTRDDVKLAIERHLIPTDRDEADS